MNSEELEPTAEKGRAGKGEVLPATYGKKVPSKFGEGEELLLYGKGTPESEEEFKGWERGYRRWKLGYAGGEPRLRSIFSGEVWEPGEGGEVLSDWGGEEKEGHPFSQSSKGLYSFRVPEEVKKLGYSKEEGVSGSIIPYGDIVHAERGFRSTKAKVDVLFKESIPCYICGGSSKYLVKNDERFTLCERHAKNLKKLFERKRYTELDLEDVLNKLAEIYEAEIE